MMHKHRGTLDRDGALHLDGVKIPFVPDEEFCTPDFQSVIEFWPEYVLGALRGREYTPLTPVDFTLFLCDWLVDQNARPGRASRDWFWRILEHFGREWFDENVLRGHDA